MTATITFEQGKMVVPDTVTIPFIEGDGVGPECWSVSKAIFDAAVEQVSGGTKKVLWKELLAAEKAFRQTGEWLPEKTIDAIKHYHVAIKGPLTTPVGEGIRSVNVALRHSLSLYACIRPVKWIEGVTSPVRQPELVDMVVFRENMEDIYAGIEWAAGTQENADISACITRLTGKELPDESGIGIKYISRVGSERIMRAALQFAVQHKRRSVTIVHKGNIMKYTEGSFKKWCYELAKREFGEYVCLENEANQPEMAGRIILKDRIADNMFQQVLINPAQYDVIVTLNLNGDYLSDALAAQVGGLGLAPGGNFGQEVAIFEATHGTAPDIAGQDRVNPGSMLLSGAMLFDHLGWNNVAALIRQALGNTIKKGIVTGDLAKEVTGAQVVGTRAFAAAVIAEMHDIMSRMDKTGSFSAT